MGKIVVTLIVVLPVIWFCFRISSINKEYAPTSGDLDIVKNEIENISKEYMNAYESGEENSESQNPETEGSKYGNPISKLIENAKINASSANVYQEPDESSALVGAVYKDMVVTVQDYPNGWSNIKYGEGAGWIKSEYVTNPDDGTGNSDVLVSAVGKKATVLVDTLNVRASAVNGNVVDAVHLGDELNIIGANDSETWYEVQYGTKSGWVSGAKDLVKVNY